MKKIVILLITLVSVAELSAQVEFRSGITLGAGQSKLSNITLVPGLDYAELFSTKHNYSLGYKFRLAPRDKHLFIDIDILTGFRQVIYSYIEDYWLKNEDVADGMRPVSGFPTKTNYYQLSLNPTLNYKFYDGWYVGVGAEPSLYFAHEVSSSKTDDEFYKIDVPVTGRIGYDFKYIDVAVSYKHGLFNILDPERFNTGKLNYWQLQVFIPF